MYSRMKTTILGIIDHKLRNTVEIGYSKYFFHDVCVGCGWCIGHDGNAHQRTINIDMIQQDAKVKKGQRFELRKI